MNQEKSRPQLDIEKINGCLATEAVEGAVLYVVVYGENCRQAGLDIFPEDKVEEYTEVLDRVYEACVQHKMVYQYALMFVATGYIPYGTLIQPILEKALSTYLEKKKQGILFSDSEKEELRAMIELSLEAFDDQASFMVFFTSFREYVPFRLIPKAVDIAMKRGDQETAQVFVHGVLQPPEEVDESR